MKTTIPRMRIVAASTDGGILRIELISLYDIRDNRHMALNGWQNHTVTFETEEPKRVWGSCVSSDNDCKASHE
jgi:hypothetical protein